MTDRIAQTVIAMWLEPRTESIFHDDSYGYRPGRSPVMAVAKCVSADQMIGREADVERIEVPADDLAWLLQPGGQRPGLRILPDLLDPAKQGQGSALDIAPPSHGV